MLKLIVVISLTAVGTLLYLYSCKLKKRIHDEEVETNALPIVIERLTAEKEKFKKRQSSYSFSVSNTTKQFTRKLEEIPAEWINSYFYKCIDECNEKTKSCLFNYKSQNVYLIGLKGLDDKPFISKTTVAAVCHMAKRVDTLGICLLLEDPESEPLWTEPTLDISFSYAQKQLVGKTLILNITKHYYPDFHIEINSVNEIIEYNKLGVIT